MRLQCAAACTRLALSNAAADKRGSSVPASLPNMCVHYQTLEICEMSMVQRCCPANCVDVDVVTCMLLLAATMPTAQAQSLLANTNDRSLIRARLAACSRTAAQQRLLRVDDCRRHHTRGERAQLCVQERWGACRTKLFLARSVSDRSFRNTHIHCYRTAGV